MTPPLPPAPHATTLRALARLIGYPDAALRAHLPELREALHAQPVLGDERLDALDRLVDGLRASPGLDAEAAYVDLFDRGRGTALHLFEHVHGDSRDRGPAMIDLLQTYEAAGLYLSSDELPDHLTVVLEYASTQPADAACAFIGEIAHLLQRIHSALVRRESPYTAVLAALLDFAGETVQPAPVPAEPALDDTWAEPAAFGGCSSDGQRAPTAAHAPNAPNTPQPIQIVRRNGPPRAASADSLSHGASA